jgi:DNA uptake protein ComE-like DNA-binding protein
MTSIRAAALASIALLIASPAFAQTAAPSPSGKPSTTSRPGMSTPPTPMAKPSTAAPSTPRPAPTATHAVLDINSATKEQLDALPQVGAARAEAIIKGRPYRAKSDLVDKKILPKSAYDAIKDRIVARQK